MLHSDILVVDMDPRHWRNLLALFSPGKEGEALLLVFLDAGECVKAIHTRQGPLPGFRWPGKEGAEEVRKRRQVERIALIPVEAVEAFLSRWQNDFRRHADWDLQILSLAKALRVLIREEIDWLPPLPRRDSRLSPERAGRLARFWPDESCLGFFLFEKDRPYTSLILGKSRGGISLMTTLEAFGMAEGPLSWQTQRENVARMCRNTFFPLHAGLWMDRSTWLEMTAGPRPISYLRAAVIRRRAILWPAPFTLRLGLFLARRFGGL